MRFRYAHIRGLFASAILALGCYCPAGAAPVQAMSAAAFLSGFSQNSHLNAAPVNHGSTYFSIFSPAETTTAQAELHVLHALLDGQLFSAGMFDFRVADMPAYGHQLLMQKSNGTFVLALWNETHSADVFSQGSHPAGKTVTLQLPAVASLIQVFDPSIGIRAQQTMTNATTIPISLPDHPILIFIVPQIQSL